MFKLSIMLVSIIFLNIAEFAHANNLDASWVQPRKEANALGDAAKGGDANAYARLTQLANYENHAPAMHNMGWLFQSGFFIEKDKNLACDWFEKAASLHKYPPAMHNYAICLFEKSENWISDENAVSGRQLMSDAADLGWTNSAIVLSEKILNTTLLSKEDANTAFMLSSYALNNTRPSREEFVSLQYLVGMAAILGPGSRRYYHAGHGAMSIALSSGHARAFEELPRIETLWVREVLIWIDRLDNYEDSDAKRFIGRCYEHLADKNIRLSVVGFCKKSVEIELNEVIALTEDAENLVTMVTGEDGKKLRAVIGEFKKRTGPYRRAQLKWEINFIPKYNARAKERELTP